MGFQCICFVYVWSSLQVCWIGKWGVYRCIGLCCSVGVCGVVCKLTSNSSATCSYIMRMVATFWLRSSWSLSACTHTHTHTHRINVPPSLQTIWELATKLPGEGFVCHWYFITHTLYWYHEYSDMCKVHESWMATLRHIYQKFTHHRPKIVIISSRNKHFSELIWMQSKTASLDR